MTKHCSNCVYEVNGTWRLLWKGDYIALPKEEALLFQAQQQTQLTLKVGELTDHALTWAVAVALDYDPYIDVEDISGKPLGPGQWQRNYEDYLIMARYIRRVRIGEFRPLTDYNVGGPLLDAHRISTEVAGDGWAALYNDCFAPATYGHASHGATRLEAGLRCLVAKLHGPEITVPAELVEPDIRRRLLKQA
jgi:hypothetical protein